MRKFDLPHRGNFQWLQQFLMKPADRFLSYVFDFRITFLATLFAVK
jgi:hypothetical protein